MIELLVRNPLLLLFIVAAVGYLLGRVSLGGVKLGVAAVLFVGLAFGALDERLKLPEIIYLLGLVLFVYTIGLSSGPSFSIRCGARACEIICWCSRCSCWPRASPLRRSCSSA